MMRSQEIKMRINELNRRLEEVIKNYQFMLNKETERIYHEIDEIQKQCAHSFEDGVCIFCGKEEEEKEE